jgi:predicted nuclease of predicted toxin-antitoxin system
MKLIADEGVDKPIVDALRNHGFDVLYILEDYRSADDDFILALSDSLNAVLLTQDKDLVNLYLGLNVHILE